MTVRTVARSLKRNPGAVIGGALLLLQLVAIVFAPLITHYSPTAAYPEDSLLPPGWQHWLGTDESGMDIYTRIVFATRINLLIAIVAVSVSFAIGVPVGVIIGFYRGPISALTMRLFDFIQSFPVFVLGMALVSVLGQEIWNVAIVLAVLFIPMFAPDAAGRGAVAAGTPVHQRRTVQRRERFRDHVPAHPAERADAGHRAGVHLHRHGNPVDGRPVLHRGRGADANA